MAYLLALLLAFGGEVLTQHNDNSRTGAYNTETSLTPANIPSQFGRLPFTYVVDGQIYAQPLVAEGRVYIATEANNLYAFDAETATVLWRTGQEALGDPVTAPPKSDGGACRDIRSDVGITATPVIEPPSPHRRIFVSAKSADGYRLFALDLSTGKVINSTVIQGGSFDPFHQLNRPGLLLDNGVIYVAFGSHCDTPPYHGYIFAFRASDLHPLGSFCTSCATPASGGNAIWQAGNGLSADGEGNIYTITGNGSSGENNYSDSFLKLKLDADGLHVVSSFTPENDRFLSECDLDLGSAGPVLLPGTPPLVIGGGKEGVLYLLNRSDLKERSRLSGGIDQYPASGPVPTAEACKSDPKEVGHAQNMRPHIHGSPVVWQPADGGPARLFVWAEKDYMRAFTVEPGGKLTPAETTTYKLQRESMPGAMLALSSNAGRDAVLWAAYNVVSCSDQESPADANAGPQPGMFAAYDARDIGRVLWTSCGNEPRDGFGKTDRLGKFIPPTIANGRVYIGSWEIRKDEKSDILRSRVFVYGLLNAVKP